MNKLLVICGPTATGKTGLGIRLAKEFEGEIISVDSRQVYRGMNIGTGKDIAGGVWRTVRRGKERESGGYWEVEGVPIHLLDIVNPNEEFSVAHYYRLAWQEIKNLWRRGKLPVLAGGTGFYIRAVVDGIETKDVPRNLEIRTRIKDWSPEKLFDQLAKLDSERAALMNHSDRNNSRRLARAIEVAIFRNENPSWRPLRHQKPNALFIGLKIANEMLDKRIEMRVKGRLKEGLEDEIRTLLNQGYAWESSALNDTLAYKEWRSFFEGEKTREEVIDRWQTDEGRYARKQMTWFRKDKRINWFDISQKRWQDRAVRLVKKWLVEGNAQQD